MWWWCWIFTPHILSWISMWFFSTQFIWHKSKFDFEVSALWIWSNPIDVKVMKIKIDLSTLVEVKQNQVHLYYKMWGCTQLNNGHLTFSTEKLFLQCENRYRKNLDNKLCLLGFFSLIQGFIPHNCPKSRKSTFLYQDNNSDFLDGFSVSWPNNFR